MRLGNQPKALPPDALPPDSSDARGESIVWTASAVYRSYVPGQCQLRHAAGAAPRTQAPPESMGRCIVYGCSWHEPSVMSARAAALSNRAHVPPERAVKAETLGLQLGLAMQGASTALAQGEGAEEASTAGELKGHSWHQDQIPYIM